ncbi:MAG TPA: hypothetical protein VNM45_06610 [Bacillus sp. (in: firmicutes)]|nr:hypothetical protein [Bacillus sp. (in: firmicutes)]
MGTTRIALLMATAATAATLSATRLVIVDKDNGWFTLTMALTTFMTFPMLALMFIFSIIIFPDDDLTVTLFPTILFYFTAALITHSSFPLA